MHLILIVEDEYGTAEVLQLVLESQGFRVESAPNGNVALTLLAKEKPAVIVSDFMMPHMTGAEFGAAVRGSVEWADLPFIITSGTSEAVIQQSFKDYDAFFSKPYDIDQLISLVNEFASKGRAVRQRDPEVDESMRHLLRGIRMPSAD